MKVYHFLHEEYALEAIRNSRIKVAEYGSLNDPFELNAANLGNREVRRRLQSFAADWSSKYGICSFSRSWRHPLMWSHYANHHRGVALEFDLADSHAIPVKYSQSKVKFDYEYVMRNGISESLANRLIMTKYSGWSYEGEVRIVASLKACSKENGFYFCDFDEDLHLTGFIIGPLCDLTIDRVKSEKSSKNPLKVWKARLGFQDFMIVRDKTVPITELE